MGPNKLKYYAFISYKREDARWAKWLQRELEHYRLPKNNRAEYPFLNKGIRPVFRDSSDLSSGLLANEIHKALEQSQFLIIICSPLAATSPWVANEVQHFIDIGREKQIIPFIISGVPFSPKQEEECFPLPLRKLTGDRELRGINISEMGKEAALVKVVARIVDCRFDNLWQRFEREKRRHTILWFAIAVALLLISLGVSAYIAHKNVLLDMTNHELALANERVITEMDHAKQERDRANLERDRANRERDYAQSVSRSLRIANDSILRQQAQILRANHELRSSNWLVAHEYKNLVVNQSRRLVEVSSRLLDSSDYLNARKVALSSLPRDLNTPDRPILPEAEAALRTSWNANSGELSGHSDNINTIGYCTDGSVIYSFSRNNTIKFWDPVYGNEISSLPLNYHVSTVHFSPGLRKLVMSTGSWPDNRVCVYDMVNNKWLIKKNEKSRCAAFNPSGDMVASGDPLRLWDANTGETMRSFELSPTQLSYSSDGQLLAVEDNQHAIVVLEVDSGKELLRYERPFIYSFSISPDNQFLACASDELQLFDIKSGEIQTIIQDGALSVCFSPDGNHLATGMRNGDVRIYETSSWEVLDVINTTKRSRVWNLCYSPDGNRLVYSSDDNKIQILDLDPYKDFIGVELKSSSGNTPISISHDGSLVAQGLFKGAIRVWDLKTGSIVSELHPDYPLNYCVSIDPTGEYLLSTDGSGSTMRIWDIKSGKEIRTIKRNGFDVINCCWSPDGQKILCINWDGIRMFDFLPNGGITQSITIPTPSSRGKMTSAAFSPDGSIIVAAFESSLVSFYDADSGEELTEPFYLSDVNDYSIGIEQIKYNPDGSRLAVQFTDNSIRIYDVATSRELSRFYNTLGYFAGPIVFSPDGRLIAMDTEDSFSIWDVESGILLNKIEGFMYPAFIPNRDALVAMKSQRGNHNNYVIEFPPLKEMVNKTKAFIEHSGIEDSLINTYDMKEPEFTHSDIDEWCTLNRVFCQNVLKQRKEQKEDVLNDMIEENPCLAYLILQSKAPLEERQKWYKLYASKDQDNIYSLFNNLLKEWEKALLNEEGLEFGDMR